MFIKKACYYLSRFLNLCIACLRLTVYCLIHPKEIGKLLFPIFSRINAFYQVSHGRLENLEETDFFKNITDQNLFAKANIFNVDKKVMHRSETLVLASLVYAIAPQSIFEIGTYDGLTTLHFAKNTPKDCKIYTLDLPEDYQTSTKTEAHKYSYDDLLVVKLSTENIHNRAFKQHPEKDKIVELFGDSTRFDFSPYYKKIDLVYIDGNHSYEYVQSDTEQALKMLSDKGMIIWHDFDYIIHRDVFRYLNQLSESLPIYSVPKTRFAIYGKHLT